MAVAPHPSWAVRAARWTAERFPPALAVAIAVLYAVAAGVGYADATATAEATRGSGDQLALGAVAIVAWFLMIRTLDDLEDQPEDDVAHPGRALQRGAVSRADLLRLGAVAVVVQAAAVVAIDGGLGPITAIWTAMIAFLGLLAVDFGLPRALAARPGLRRSLRAPASVAPVVLAFSIGWGDAHADLSTVGVVAAIAAVVAWYDVVRRRASEHPPAAPADPSPAQERTA